MARRVRFDGSGISGSPRRISVSGVDALMAQFKPAPASQSPQAVERTMMADQPERLRAKSRQ
jgi:hypothetical protein